MPWANEFFTLANKTIVIVETDILLLDVLAIALTQEGYQVILTSYYHTVFDLVIQHQPAIVIIEYRLRRNEAKLLSQQLQKINDKPILLALSSNADISFLYAQEGFEGYITKPFELDDLFNTVNSFLS